MLATAAFNAASGASAARLTPPLCLYFIVAGAGLFAALLTMLVVAVADAPRDALLARCLAAALGFSLGSGLGLGCAGARALLG